ncbi:MAG: glycoside hydrolase family 9 protein [Verrucomicrobiales bacterium]|nr:glycoside hydrolase family 9 protein [Verrucomicrobiales bacterium]
MKPVWLLTLVMAFIKVSSAGVPEFNYAEALQKSLYFFEAQQSGTLSPNNRVEWRGPACLTDGQDIGRDLSGGWFDAGDHWTANLTMSFAAMTLAWSAVEYPQGFLQTGQMGVLLEELIHVNRYFLKCVLNPDCRDPATELEVVMGCGGREGVEPPRVHDLWAAAEVASLMTRRPTLRITHQVPAADIPAAMAAAMASSSMVIREQGSLLRNRPGFQDFDATAFADVLLDRASLLTRFAAAHAGPVLAEGLSEAERERIRKARRLALRSDGVIVETGYRADPFDKIVSAASWLQRAAQGRDRNCGTEWLTLALDVYEQGYKAESNHDWWKDYGAGNFGKQAAYNLMRLRPEDERFHAELQLYCSRFWEYRRTPGGLRLREWFAHEYGSLRHANNAAVIALYYSDYVERAPTIQGNTWWKAGRSNADLKTQYLEAAKSQVDYALGANPYGRSYLVGFGHQPFNHVHHRGAYGPWAGFEHFIPHKADDRGTNRHILYGALVAGPDHQDVFLCGKDHRLWQPVPGTPDSDFYYQFPNRSGLVRKEGYTWDASDLPFQDVMDSQFNEVALDYNAGFTASLVWLCAHGRGVGRPLPEDVFPPREVRHETEDLRTTDREFFVAARRLEATPESLELELVLHNRSRWPARASTNLSVRIPVAAGAATAPPSLSVSLVGDSRHPVDVRQVPGGGARLEISFAGDRVHPGSLRDGQRTVRLRLNGGGGNLDRDPWLGALPTELTLQPRITVWEGNRCVGGDPRNVTPQ